MASIPLQFNLLELFSKVDSDAKYNMKGMICYVGGHYLSFIKRDVSKNDENKSEWVIFNDTSVYYKSTW